MNDSNQFSLADALRNLLKKHNLEDVINEQRLRESWHKTVGDYCNRHTVSLKFSKGQLTVKLSSAIVKQELMYAKSEVIAKLNQMLGSELVEELRIY